MDTHMRTFFDKMESQLAIPQGTLWEKWSENNNNNNPSTEKPKDVKKSNYQVFFSIQRNIITSANSGISFGDVSKQVSSMWKQMTPEEKAKYATDASTTTITTTNKKPSSRKKKVTVTAPTKPIEVDTGSVEIVHTGKKSGRSKLELTADEEKEEDEEDFFFQEDHSRSDEEDVEEDDDEEDVLEEDVDGDMFVDDD
jgi:hypothetical protein